MKDIIYKEVKTDNPKIKVGILIYRGEGDPAKYLNEAVHQYVKNEGYNEFKDANLDNPWVRVIIKGINEIKSVEFDPAFNHL